jgi:ParB family chromosome partitioning protein
VSEKRRGLGRGLGALIPSGTAATKPAGERPVDVFFQDSERSASPVATLAPVGEPVEDAIADGEHEATVDLSTAVATDAEVEALLRSVAPADGPPGDGVAESGVADSGVADTSTDEGDSLTWQTPPPADLVPVPGVHFADLPVSDIRPNPRQPRQVFDEEDMAELVHSVREIGVLQPVVVRPVGDEDGVPRYELIMGERRWRATQAAGLDRIPAIVRETGDDVLLRDALLENLHRSQLNALEKAAAYQQLLDDFGCTHDELAGRIGRSRPQISNTIRLLKLPVNVQRRVAAGVLSAGHARALLGLEDADAMDRLAQRIVAEGLSVRAVEEIVALGDEPAKTRAKRPRPGMHRSELDDVAARLGDRLDTRVGITLGRSKGRLSIDFASVEDLNRILTIIAPDERGAFRG